MAIDITLAFELDENGLALFVDDTTTSSVTAGSADPTITGFPTAFGSIYLRTNGTMYIKTGALDTDWDITATEAFVSGGFQPLDADLSALAAIATTGIYVITGPGTSTTRTITGTPSRISLTFGDGVGGNPTIDIDATYVGQTSITTLGTITSGTWHGTTIETTHGGTGLTSYLTGDLIYASAPNVLSPLNIGLNGTFLKSNGTIPGWATISGSDITGAALTKVDDTNVTLTLGGTPATALLRATSLTLGWTGQLAVSRGGTGVATFGGTNTLLYTTATDTLSSIPTANTSALVTSNTGAPGWTSGATPSRVLRTNGTTISFAQVDLTSDVTGDLPFSNLAQIAGLSVLGVSGTSTADVAAITGVANQVLRVNGAGTILGFGSIDLSQNATVGASILGTTNGGTGLSSYTQGDLIYASAANTLIQLTKDTNATRYLANTGTSNNPKWDQVNLTNGVTGILPTTNGGTGNANGTIPVSKLTDAAGANTIANADNAQIWNWTLTTAAKTAMKFGETAAATNGAGAQYLVEIATLATSTADPLRVVVKGTENFKISRSAEWLVNGTAGTLNQALLSGGPGTNPSWTTLTAAIISALADPGANGIVVRTAANVTTARTIQGTTNRISVSNGNGVSADPTIDIDAAYVGQTSITTLGTITTGTWNATTIATTRGGTGLTSYTQGDLIYASAANTLTQLAKDTNATRYLSNTGTSNNPAWSQVDLTNGVTGDLPFSNLSQIVGLSVLGVSGTSTADVAAITGTANQVLRVNGAGTVLGFGSIDLSQVATVGTSRLAYANITQGSALSVFGVAGNATADHADITAGADFNILRRSGTSIGFGSIDLSQAGAVGVSILGTANGGTGNANGTIPLDKITAAGGANSINNGDNAQTWNWALTTAAKTAFTFSENSAATNGAGAQFLVDISTIAASTANPIRIRAQANNILTVTNVGVVTLQGADTGTGSAITIRGGNSTTAATTGANATLLGGTSGTSGTGGTANVTGGVGGTTGVGGAANITGGAGGSASGNAGGVNITGGTPVAGAGGAISISGSAGVGTNQNGGGITLSGGNPTGTGTPGSISLTAGALQGAGTPATVSITGGAGNGATTGGAVTATAGSGGSTGTGAAITIKGGPGGGTSGAAGTATITGGTPVDGNGGAVTISGSAGVGTNRSGGNVIITAGAATGSGTPGLIDASATTTALRLPNGTDAQRPGAANMPAIADGQLRYNTSQDILEAFASLTTPSGFTSGAMLQKSTMLRHRRIWWKDDFITFLNTSFVGETNFQIGGTGTLTINNVTPTTDHMGVAQLQTGTTSGNNVQIFHSGNSATSPVINPAQMEYFAWLVLIPTITNISVLCGFGQTIGTDTTFGTDGIFFRFNPATNAAWQFITRAASTSTTRTTTTTVVANTWYLLEAFYDGTQWTAVINGTANTANTTNIPTAMLANGARVTTNTTAARTLNIDYWAALSAELGNRY